MNRLSPLIVRRIGPTAPRTSYAAAAVAEAESAQENGLVEDLKLFGVAWLGGLVFFGTLFG